MQATAPACAVAGISDTQPAFGFGTATAVRFRHEYLSFAVDLRLTGVRSLEPALSAIRIRLKLVLRFTD